MFTTIIADTFQIPLPSLAMSKPNSEFCLFGVTEHLVLSSIHHLGVIAPSPYASLNLVVVKHRFVNKTMFFCQPVLQNTSIAGFQFSRRRISRRPRFFMYDMVFSPG